CVKDAAITFGSLDVW
nr:immunoglobulin heavy chain junction region [Macaca mulatta]MOV48461.1 immunoglobulin heavy chain junction region [Macaca mulatta]MOV48603.1 immunoglobulin heavy chain junction region [Macaca mulatta]